MGRASRTRPGRLAEKLVDIRARLGLSQNELIRLLRLEEHLTREEISAFERSIRMPPWWVLLQLARTINVPLEVLVDDEMNLPDKLPGKRKDLVGRRTSPRKQK
jgi:transcriptional regulator with XRE-family HTH domain